MFGGSGFWMINGDWSTVGPGVVAASAGEKATPSSQTEKPLASSRVAKWRGLPCRREMMFMSIPLFAMVRHGKVHASV
ncbi:MULTISPECIES: hypothetical protein [Rhodanobacter]|nr:MULTISPECIES: hypothetical protein [Rhodanobacter]UJJ56266.1 hypothetical protein LRK53_07815 [Rhodanobacter thiooxydans]